MEPRDPFLNISPLDHRYWAANKNLFDRLSQTLSEKAAVRYTVMAELSLLRAHIHSQMDGDPALLSALEGLENRIDPDEVAKEEETTNHNIRALVNVLQRYLPEKLAPWVHLGATSVDILDTAMAMRVRDAMRYTIIPQVLDLLELACRSYRKGSGNRPGGAYSWTAGGAHHLRFRHGRVCVQVGPIDCST